MDARQKRRFELYEAAQGPLLRAIRTVEEANEGFVVDNSELLQRAYALAQTYERPQPTSGERRFRAPRLDRSIEQRRLRVVLDALDVPVKHVRQQLFHAQRPHSELGALPSRGSSHTVSRLTTRN